MLGTVFFILYDCGSPLFLHNKILPLLSISRQRKPLQNDAKISWYKSWICLKYKKIKNCLSVTFEYYRNPRRSAFGLIDKRPVMSTLSCQTQINRPVDESGVPQKGKKNVSVGKQYCGNLGKVENCLPYSLR